MPQPRRGIAHSGDHREPLEKPRVGNSGTQRPHPIRRVLVVDDSIHDRELYALYLNAVGYDARTAADGEEALVLAGVLKPDVIVLDLVLPGITGNLAAQLLKLDPRTRRIPVILLTGHPERAIQSRVIQRGVDLFLTKPCLPDELERGVRGLIEARAADNIRR